MSKPINNAIEGSVNCLIKKMKVLGELGKASVFYGNMEEAIEESSIICKTNALGHITHVNANFEKISGYSRYELLAKSYHWLKSVLQKVSNGTSWQGEICFPAKSEKIHWLDTFIYPCFNKQGMVTEYILIGYNITHKKEQEKRLANTEALLRSVLENSDDMLVFMDANRQPLVYNKKAKIVLDILDVHEAFQHRAVRHFFESLKNFDTMLNTALQCGCAEADQEVFFFTGQKTRCNINYSRVSGSDGLIMGVLVTIRPKQCVNATNQAGLDCQAL